MPVLGLCLKSCGVGLEDQVLSHWSCSNHCVTQHWAFYLGFDDVLAEAVSSIEHVQFAKNLARSHVVRQRLDCHRATHHSVQHQLELGNVFVLNTDNLYHPTHLNSLTS